jgi:hypothetical protein
LGKSDESLHFLLPISAYLVKTLI